MFKRIIHAIILNRLHITISAPAVMWCWSEFLKIRFRVIDYLIITLAVACICQWNRLTDIAEDSLNCPDELKDAQNKKRGIRIFCFAAGSAAILLAFFTEPTWQTAALIIFGAVTGFFYNTPFIPSMPRLRLKNMLLIKNLSSGAGWSAGLLIFPTLRVHAQTDVQFLSAVIYMFAMVTTYEIMWDMRDVAGDRKAGIRTLPAVFGINGARIIVGILQFLCLGVMISGLSDKRLSAVWSLYLLPNMALLALIIFSPQPVRFNRRLSHILVIALGIYACFSGFCANRFG